MIKIKIDAFEGPLDLLLHLIEQAEVDIYDISVAEITDQYVAYIRTMQELELEIASEFLVMAATLLAIKSKMLLPQEEEYAFQTTLDMDVEEADPRAELIQRLVEYKKYKQLAAHLREKETERSQTYTRPSDDLSVFIEEEPNPVKEVSLFDLLRAFQLVLQKPPDEPLAKVEREEWSIGERMVEIKSVLAEKHKVAFSHFFQETKSKNQVIVTFLALLELMKKREIYCYQKRLFDEIWMTSRLEEQKDGH